jgi:hypothetical protein
MSRTLPDGWTGNDAHHHREVGAFRIEVRKHRGRYLAEVWLGRSLVCRTDAHGHPSAAEARDAAVTRILQLAAEVVAILSMEATR